MKKLTLTLLAAFAVAGTSFAGTTVSTKEYKQPVVTPCFQDTEFAMDVFYTYNDACHQGSSTSLRTDSFTRTSTLGSSTITDRFGVAVSDSTPQYFRDGSGGGVGFDYFFARYFGVSVEGNWWVGANASNTFEGAIVRDRTISNGSSSTTTRTVSTGSKTTINHDVTHQVTGSVIFRYPIEGSFCWAPYLFGGGGGIWDGKSTGFGHVGLGAEWRVTPKIGIFSDWRWEFTSRNDINSSRLGVRFIF